MNGWIIHKKQLGENHEVERLVEEFEKQGVKIRVVNPQDVDIFVDRDDRKSILVEGKPRKLQDPRVPSRDYVLLSVTILPVSQHTCFLVPGCGCIRTQCNSGVAE